MSDSRITLQPGQVYRLPNGDCVVARYSYSIPAEGQPVDPDDYRDPERDSGHNWVLEPIDGDDKGKGVYLVTHSDEGTDDLFFIGIHTRVRPIPGSIVHEICDSHTPTAIRLTDISHLTFARLHRRAFRARV